MPLLVYNALVVRLNSPSGCIFTLKDESRHEFAVNKTCI